MGCKGSEVRILSPRPFSFPSLQTHLCQYLDCRLPAQLGLNDPYGLQTGEGKWAGGGRGEPAEPTRASITLADLSFGFVSDLKPEEPERRFDDRFREAKHYKDATRMGAYPRELLLAGLPKVNPLAPTILFPWFANSPSTLIYYIG